MSKIVLGKSEQGDVVEADVDVLLLTRLLITANSGGGKSYLTRVLIELLRSKVQEIILDPEDEFSSLREKFDFAQIGEGGEAPMHVRSAAILAERLLEHRFSAICNLYELKADQRPVWVRLFIDSMMNAPKKLWHPVIIWLDEAQMFAPEDGKCESYGSVVDLATRGRKRGFCLIPCVQRLADLTKKVTGQMLNRLVGPTFEDVDLDRAVKVLSVAKADEAKFREEIKLLEPGDFYALGRAISKTRILFKVRKAQTSHPEPGKVSRNIPGLPAHRLKAMLPVLADLPQAAEEKAKTEADLRAELRTVRSELLQAKTRLKVVPVAAAPVKIAPAPASAPKVIKIPAIPASDIKRIESAVSQLERLAEKIAPLSDTAAVLRGAATTLGDRLSTTARLLAQPIRQAPAAPSHSKSVTPPTPSGTPVKQPLATPAEAGDRNLSAPQLRILGVLAFFKTMEILDVPRTWVAPLSGVSHTSGGYGNNLGRLRSLGHIDYRLPGTMFITPEGEALAGEPEALSPEEILFRCKASVTGPQALILTSLRGVFPGDYSRDDLAAMVAVSPSSGGYGNNLGALRSAGMIRYTSPGRVCMANWVAGSLEREPAAAAM